MSLPATTEATRFGKYGLVARLATGGMAEIFLALLQGAAGFEKLVCIKRILPHLARDKQFVSMFLDEARIAARISHPNVCQVFELGEIEGSYYLAMEYLEGVPLACFRRPDLYGQMPDPRLVAGLAIQACEGLHHAHQLKNADGSVMDVVHRDVSPQNLFVTVDGIVKVLDFGIAKIQDATVRTSTGAVKGTYAYMAPEQLRGERVDRRTDVFAIGIVMWETLMRRHLFRRDTDFLTFQAITTDPIEDVAALRADVPAALSRVIMTALARDREQRYPTARQLGEAIAAAVQPLSTSAVSEEIARAFPAELAEQAALIQVARVGGAFALDFDRGPSLSLGTALFTTPTSHLRSVQQELAARRTPSSGLDVVSGSDPELDFSAPVSAPGPASGPYQVPSGPYQVPSGSNQVPSPASPSLRSWRPLVIAAIALALGGGGAFVYARLLRAPDPVHPIAPSGPATPDRAVAIAAPLDAAPADAPGAVDAAPIDAPADAAPIDAAPDAADAEPRRDPTPAKVVTAPVKRPPPPDKVVRPSGPPGFITIDSSPVYAVIYIDGKNYGETPLVKLALPAGRHVVHAVAPSGASRDVRISIESGKTAPASRIEW